MTRRDAWATNLATFVVVVIVAYAFACSIRCALQAGGSWLRIPGLLLALAAAIGLRKTWFAPGGLLAVILAVLILGAPSQHLPDECCDGCYAPDGDPVAIASALIRGEELVVTDAPKLGLIDRIYDLNAQVTNVATGGIAAVQAHYKTITSQYRYTWVLHTTPTLILNSVTRNEFKVSTVSFGEYVPRGSNAVTRFQGIDLWTIARNGTCQCWKITAFSFNVNQ